MTNELRDNLFKIFDPFHLHKHSLRKRQDYNYKLLKCQKCDGILESCDSKFFSNVYTCLHLMLIIPVITAATEHSHSSLKKVESNSQTKMGEDKLTATMLLYVTNTFL